MEFYVGPFRDVVTRARILPKSELAYLKNANRPAAVAEPSPRWRGNAMTRTVWRRSRSWTVSARLAAYACRSICYEHDVRLLSVTQCSEKWKRAHDRIGRCLGYVHAKADPDSNLLWFMDFIQ